MKGLHRGWFILALLVLTMLGSLGFGRFSLGAILPFMREGLQLDYKEIGFVASAAFLGYLISVAIIGNFTIKFGAKAVLNTSLLIVAVGMVLCANANGFWVAYAGCLLMGLGSGGSSIPAMGLAGQWFAKDKRGMAIGIVMGGAGVGIVISGIIVPAIVTNYADSGWRLSWVLLAAIIGVFIFLNIVWLKNSPKQVNLSPVGEKLNSTVISHSTKETDQKNDSVYKNKVIWMIGIIYLTWGFSYLIFSTFLVDYLISDRAFSEETAGLFFSGAGLASIISGFLWGGTSDRLGRMYTLSIVLFIQFVILFALSVTYANILILLEVLVYGMTLWAVPTIMNASVTDYINIRYVPMAMGFITIFFSVGQVVSPVVTGYIIDVTHHYIGVFILSSAVSLLGAIGAVKIHLHQKRVRFAESEMPGKMGG
ncbi:MFS transporter [Bacillus tianshenii]|nr:MFS transporter [Bacillus tianshenii]